MRVKSIGPTDKVVAASPTDKASWPELLSRNVKGVFKSEIGTEANIVWSAARPAPLIAICRTAGLSGKTNVSRPTLGNLLGPAKMTPASGGHAEAVLRVNTCMKPVTRTFAAETAGVGIWLEIG